MFKGINVWKYNNSICIYIWRKDNLLNVCRSVCNYLGYKLNAKWIIKRSINNIIFSVGSQIYL